MRRLFVPAALALSCRAELPPEGHLLVHLDTDAPVPGDPERRAPLLDSARIEVLDAGGQVVARREVGLDHARLVEGVSFTVTGVGLRVRATAWLAATGVTEPRPTESVTTTFALPAPPAEGARPITLFLSLATLGARDQVGAPEEGRAAPRVGTFAGAARRGCSGAPRPGEVCVPGGAFYMGHPALGGLGISSADQRRLVVLPPFFLDAHEVTVAAYRRDGKVFASRWSGSYAGTDPKDHCTFTEAPGPHETHPINCVRWEKAREFCQLGGGDLPSEAQLEWAGTALGAGLYPWGSSAPTCADTVFGRGGGSKVGELAAQPRVCPPTSTAPRDLVGFPEPVDGPLRADAVALPTGIVRDLAGNLREWALDRYATEGAPCWAPRAPNVLVSPVCDTVDPSVTGPAYGTRGTAFYLPAWFAPAGGRFGEVEGAHLDLGFRCARPDG